MSDVYIVGAGIHPFGRHKDKTGLEQGIHAVIGHHAARRLPALYRPVEQELPR